MFNILMNESIKGSVNSNPHHWLLDQLEPTLAATVYTRFTEKYMQMPKVF